MATIPQITIDASAKCEVHGTARVISIAITTKTITKTIITR